MNEIVSRIQQFLESEARSCSMDFGCVTPEYVCRMWGGNVSVEEIAAGLEELRKQGVFTVYGSGLRVHGSWFNVRSEDNRPDFVGRSVFTSEGFGAAADEL